MFFQLGNAHTDSLLRDVQMLCGPVHASIPSDSEDGIYCEGVRNKATLSRERIPFVIKIPLGVHAFIVTLSSTYTLPLLPSTA